MPKSTLIHYPKFQNRNKIQIKLYKHKQNKIEKHPSKIT